MAGFIRTSRLSVLLLATTCLASGPARAAGVQVISDSLANQTLSCEGGNESGGHDYYFNTGTNAVERIDHRFPDQGLEFHLGGSSKGKLQQHWSYETLSEKNNDRIMLYERLSLRSPTQNRHIYRTYELASYGGRIQLTVYDGVNGARDWKVKTTRDCFKPGTKVARRAGRKYWSTTFSR